jgi:hypothetical protein
MARLLRTLLIHPPILFVNDNDDGDGKTMEIVESRQRELNLCQFMTDSMVYVRHHHLSPPPPIMIPNEYVPFIERNIVKESNMVVGSEELESEVNSYDTEMNHSFRRVVNRSTSFLYLSPLCIFLRAACILEKNAFSSDINQLQDVVADPAPLETMNMDLGDWLTVMFYHQSSFFESVTNHLSLELIDMVVEFAEMPRCDSSILQMANNVGITLSPPPFRSFVQSRPIFTPFFEYRYTAAPTYADLKWVCILFYFFLHSIDLIRHGQRFTFITDGWKNG